MMQEEIRQIKLGSGSGSTVCSDPSTAVGKGPPQGIGNRLDDWFMSRKIEFKGHYKQCSYQGQTDTEFSDFIGDLQKMLPDTPK